MKIILSELDKLLLPECYKYTADRIKNEKAYLLVRVKNIWIVVTIVRQFNPGKENKIMLQEYRL